MKVERGLIRDKVRTHILEPVERYFGRLTEQSGAGATRTYLLLMATLFAGMTGFDIAANIVIPSLHSFDGAAVTGALSAVSGTISATI